MPTPEPAGAPRCPAPARGISDPAAALSAREDGEHAPRPRQHGVSATSTPSSAVSPSSVTAPLPPRPQRLSLHDAPAHGHDTTLGLRARQTAIVLHDCGALLGRVEEVDKVRRVEPAPHLCAPDKTDRTDRTAPRSTGAHGAQWVGPLTGRRGRSDKTPDRTGSVGTSGGFVGRARRAVRAARTLRGKGARNYRRGFVGSVGFVGGPSPARRAASSHRVIAGPPGSPGSRRSAGIGDRPSGRRARSRPRAHRPPRAPREPDPTRPWW